MSSNQFSGASTAYSATLRVPPSTRSHIANGPGAAQVAADVDLADRHRNARRASPGCSRCNRCFRHFEILRSRCFRHCCSRQRRYQSQPWPTRRYAGIHWMVSPQTPTGRSVTFPPSALCRHANAQHIALTPARRWRLLPYDASGFRRVRSGSHSLSNADCPLYLSVMSENSGGSARVGLGDTLRRR